jgi:hypothetical protein
VLGEFDFPRRRWWHPTAAWEQAWRRNLARAPRRHTAEQSLAIKHAVWDWLEQDPNTRPIQEDLAASLGVSKQHINRLVHSLPPRISLPPIHHAVIPRSGPVAVSGGLDGHGWNCECAGCRAKAAIDTAVRDARRELPEGRPHAILSMR